MNQILPGLHVFLFTALGWYAAPAVVNLQRRTAVEIVGRETTISVTAHEEPTGSQTTATGAEALAAPTSPYAWEPGQWVSSHKIRPPACRGADHPSWG